MTEIWTPERTKSLIQLWAEGHSARSIAEKLELRSRSAVIGKVRRLDLPTPEVKLATAARITQVRKRKQRLAATAARITQVRKRKQRLAAIPVPADNLSEKALHLEFDQLESRHCRFPYGEGPYTYCGHPKLANTSYCEAHVAYCFEVTA